MGKQRKRKGVEREGKAKEEGEGREFEFYCDACVETEIEKLIPEDATALGAEKLRTSMRTAEAKRRGKTTKYRTCYIATKVTSVPCRSDGSVSARYTPRRECHPWDTAVPQVGRDWFEGMGGEEEGEEEGGGEKGEEEGGGEKGEEEGGGEKGEEEGGGEKGEEEEKDQEEERDPTVSTDRSSPINLGEECDLYLAYMRHNDFNHSTAQNREDIPTTSSPQRRRKRREADDDDNDAEYGNEDGVRPGKGGGRGRGKAEGAGESVKRRKVMSSLSPL